MRENADGIEGCERKLWGRRDWLTAAINDPLGKVVEACLTTIGKAKTSKRAVNEGMEALMELWGNGGYGKKMVAVILAQHPAWLLSRAPEVFQR